MSEKIAKSNKTYERRQIVAYVGSVGTFRMNGRTFNIPKYMTFYTGKNSPAIAAVFKGEAPRDNYGYLRIEDMEEGEILVDPAFVFKKIPMTGMLMAQHLQAMKTFKPKEDIVYEKDTSAPAVDLGSIDLTGVTLQ